MNKDTFMQQLQAKGFPEPVLTRKEAGAVAAHTHQFEPMALITEGEMSLEIDGQKSIYQVGDVFHLQPNQLHSEQYGPNGVTYLVSRKG